MMNVGMNRNSGFMGGWFKCRLFFLKNHKIS